MAEDVLVRIRTVLDAGGIEGARRELDELEGAAGRVGDRYTDLGRKIGGAFALAGTAAVAFLKSGIDAADALNKISERTNLSVESLSKLKFAAEQSNTNFESLSSGLQRLSLGLAKAGVDGSQLESVFLGVAEKIQNTSSATEQAAIANAAFGRGIGFELLPLLKQGGDGIEALKDRAKELGLELSGETAQRGLWRLSEAQKTPPWEWRKASRKQPQEAPQKRGRPQEAPSDSAAPTCGSKRYCREMLSCQEARYYLSKCGLTRLDSDGDGVPCESLC